MVIGGQLHSSAATKTQHMPWDEDKGAWLGLPREYISYADTRNLITCGMYDHDVEYVCNT